MEYFNGTKFSDKAFPTDIHNMIGMQGVISSSEYDAMLKKPRFGKMTSLTFKGYNTGEGSYFPFWSSEAYTYASSLVAISHYDSIATHTQTRERETSWGQWIMDVIQFLFG